MTTETKRPRGRPQISIDNARKMHHIYVHDDLWQFCIKQSRLEGLPASRYIEQLIRRAEIETRIL